MSSQSENGCSLLLSCIPKPEIAEDKEVKDMQKLRATQIEAENKSSDRHISGPSPKVVYCIQ